MTLSKEEFQVMVMLYAANIDGNIQQEEIDVMLEKYNADTYKKVNKLFSKMNDTQVLDCIDENKSQYLATEADKKQFVDDFKAIIEADEEVTLMETIVLVTIQKLLGIDLES